MSSFENKIIFWISVLCWWIDSRFDKNTEWCARKCYIGMCPLLILVYELLFDGFLQKTQLEAMGIFLDFFKLLVFLVLTEIFFFNRGLLKLFSQQAKISPNPNKNNITLLTVKIVVIFLGIMFVWYQRYWALLYCCGYLCTLYVLCVDPMPPEEKERRKQKNLKLSLA